ncbi:MAG: DNA primase, partial [Dehalococcoidales bacterium]|nr:DNA primase [Dehalococcoidales bacterium]
FHSEKTPSFFVYPEQQSWHCFGACNTGGVVFSFLLKKECLSFGEALRQLAERAGVTLPSRVESGTKSDEKARLYQLNQLAAQYFHHLLITSPAAETARGYVRRRGLSADTAASFQLGFSLNNWQDLKDYLTERGYTEEELLAAGLIIKSESGEAHDRFRNRLMFPVSDIRGQITGFGARALDDSLPKYLNSPQTPVFDKSGSLYGINLAAPAIRQQNRVVLVEGFMDVITAHQHGFNNVIAAMGTAITEKQISLLKRITRNIILSLDADAAGEEAMLRSVSYENTLQTEVRVITLPPNKDPDDVIKGDPQFWQQLIRQALPLMDFAFNMVTTNLDLTTARDKSFAATRLLPIIAEMKDQVRQGHYLQKLADTIGVSERRLEASLKDYLSRQQPGTPRDPERVNPIFSRPREEYCLALLLQYPELKQQPHQPLAEYFQNSENREIFTAWQEVTDLSSLRNHLDSTIGEHLDYLLNYLKQRNLPTNQIEEKYAKCALNLEEEFLQSLEIKRAAALALEAKLGGNAAELAKLSELGIEVNTQLGEVFNQKRQRASKGR